MSLGQRRPNVLRGTLILLSLVVSLLATACSGPLKYSVRGSRDPGADLNVTAEVNSGSNITVLDLLAVNLAPPDRISTGATSYVVWARRNAEAGWVRLGALDYDAESRKGQLLKASTPEIAFDLMVTAESMGTAASPSPDAVFQQRVQKQ